MSDDTVDIETLLAIVGATDPNQDQDKATSNDVFQYILNRKIVLGNNAIPTDLLYQDYCRNVEEPLRKIPFSREFNKYFKAKRTGSLRYYKLDATKLDLPADYSPFKAKYNGKIKAPKNDQSKKTHE